MLSRNTRTVFALLPSRQMLSPQELCQWVSQLHQQPLAKERVVERPLGEAEGELVGEAEEKVKGKTLESELLYYQ
jgi:hypothetical protein